MATLQFNFPLVKFAATATAEEQINHFFSEVDEVIQAGPNITRETDLEMMDVLHSIQTYFSVRGREKGMAYIVQLKADTVIKNRKRGYYLEQSFEKWAKDNL